MKFLTILSFFRSIISPGRVNGIYGKITLLWYSCEVEIVKHMYIRKKVFIKVNITWLLTHFEKGKIGKTWSKFGGLLMFQFCVAKLTPFIFYFSFFVYLKMRKKVSSDISREDSELRIRLRNKDFFVRRTKFQMNSHWFRVFLIWSC